MIYHEIIDGSVFTVFYEVVSFFNTSLNVSAHKPLHLVTSNIGILFMCGSR